MKVIVTNNSYQYTMRDDARELGCKKYDGTDVPNDTVCTLIQINRIKNKATIYCIRWGRMYHLIEHGGIEIYSL